MKKIPDRSHPQQSRHPAAAKRLEVSDIPPKPAEIAGFAGANKFSADAKGPFAVANRSFAMAKRFLAIAFVMPAMAKQIFASAGVTFAFANRHSAKAELFSAFANRRFALAEMFLALTNVTRARPNRGSRAARNVLSVRDRDDAHDADRSLSDGQALPDPKQRFARG